MNLVLSIFTASIFSSWFDDLNMYFSAQCGHKTDSSKKSRRIGGSMKKLVLFVVMMLISVSAFAGTRTYYRNGQYCSCYDNGYSVNCYGPGC